MHTLQDDSKSTGTLLQPLVVCGPSGVGKGTIIEKYMSEFGGRDRFGFSVSHTTRAPRPGEVNGVHYHFVEQQQMQEQILRGGCFVEHAQVHGNYYGTSWSSLRDVQDSGKTCLLDIDVQGVKQLKQLQESEEFQPKYLFIAPPSLEILQQRLSMRGTESKESLLRRTANAKAEMEYGLEEGNFDLIVVNNDLDKACVDFDAAINALYDNVDH